MLIKTYVRGGQVQKGRVARSNTRADRDRERSNAALSAPTGQTVAPARRMI